jgi:seryl-tRNA synthetase
MIDIRLLRDDLAGVTAALARRGVDPAEPKRAAELETTARALRSAQEELRAQVKALSRAVADAKRAGDTGKADEAATESRRLGDEERRAAHESDQVHEVLREVLLGFPNLPSDDAPDGVGEDDNVELRRWWPGKDGGQPAPVPEDHQRVPHWEIGESLGILDMERGARLSGSMFPLFAGLGSRLLRALTAFALDAHSDAYVEIRPPTLVLTEAMTGSGYGSFGDEAYHVERDDLWAIPTAEIPLTSLRRGEILDEAELPLRFTAATPCFRREAGAAGRDTRGMLRVHEFDKVELFAYSTPDQAPAVHADIVGRAEGLLQALGLHYRVLDLCAGDLGKASARTFDFEVYAPGCDRWLEVSSVSWYRDYQARRANVRFRPSAGGAPVLVHTCNGSALAWSRIWAALIENGRQPDGTVRLPDCLGPYLGGQLTIEAR